MEQKNKTTTQQTLSCETIRVQNRHKLERTQKEKKTIAIEARDTDTKRGQYRNYLFFSLSFFLYHSFFFPSFTNQTHHQHNLVLSKRQSKNTRNE
jgi:hypothetical protein